MKKISKLTLGALAIVLIVFNFTFVNKSCPPNTNCTLLNISALQGSASELVCDATNLLTCTIGIATGTGRLIFIE